MENGKHAKAGELRSRIPLEMLPRMVGQQVHVAWAHIGCVWVLQAITGENAVLITPKTGKVLVELASDLCFTRRCDPGGIADPELRAMALGLLGQTIQFKPGGRGWKVVDIGSQPGNVRVSSQGQQRWVGIRHAENQRHCYRKEQLRKAAEVAQA